MSDTTIPFEVDAAEAMVLEAALAMYRRGLDDAKQLGGLALDAAATMDPIAQRVQMRLHDRLYGSGDPPEPEWLGDHHIYPAGVGR